MEPQYKTWRDRGGNIGVQCLVCTRIHWTGEEPDSDPQTQKPCSNCVLLRTENTRQKENDIHAQELQTFENQKASADDPKKVQFECIHTPSQ